MRKTKFANGEYYHIYNRGVDKREIFIDDRDYIRFIKYIRIFVFKEKYMDIPEAKPPSGRLSLLHPVEIICYCLNANHFHLLVKQKVENGISALMHFISTSYTMYFNSKYKRSGSLFQGTFKAAEIKSDKHLLNISAYINANSQIHGITDNPSRYPWCSYLDYIDLKKGTLCNKNIILNNFKNIGAYKIFVEESILNIRRDRKLQKLFLE